MMPSIAYLSDHGARWNLCWDNNNEILDLDLYADGRVCWFYKNRLTNQCEGTEEDPEPFYSSRLKELLTQASEWTYYETNKTL